MTTPQTVNDVYRDFENWATAVAYELGWEFVGPELQGYSINGWLESPGGVKLALDYDRSKSRVEVMPCWPEGTYNVKRSSELPNRISVGYGRDADKVAADVRKRLVIPMVAALAEIDVLLAGVKARADAQSAALTRVMGAGGYGASQNILSPVTHRTGEAGFYGLTEGYGTVTVGDGGKTGSIELRYAPIDTIIEIVELLARKEEEGLA